MQIDSGKQQDRRQQNGNKESPWSPDHLQPSRGQHAMEEVGEKNEVGAGGPNGPGTSGSSGLAAAAGAPLDDVGGPRMGARAGESERDAGTEDGDTGVAQAGGKPGGTSGTMASETKKDSSA